ncbi:MAG: transcription-repair coupling factor, partial [Thermodesulfobacteriota bacterium]
PGTTLPRGTPGPLSTSVTSVPVAQGKASIIIGELRSGFRAHDLSLAIVTEDEIFGERVKRRPPPSRRLEAFLTQLQDLDSGDYVVHSDHGIGIYRGLKRLHLEEIENDFLVLEYQGGDRLYLPAQRLNLISKYHGFEGKTPPVDRLGGSGWSKTKGKVKRAVEEMARELLELYAARNVVEGFSFSRPDSIFAEFEASFEYEETEDQQRAIGEVLDDMQRGRPMDRLVCGDVGYGKTEVAMRAAFKAVLDGKQVAILVPTTVLAQQHYHTFTKRFAPYPVQIDMLSRFRSSGEQKESVEKLKRGDTDIIIGTHRLLQRDVVFKNLGLVVVDEEHRFGVRHKERLKQIRKHVDVLTLTATPIPRTLHMSFAGIRDLSIINTPPEERLAIKTIVTRFDEATVRDAVMRELLRGGQVFFVHNRVSGIDGIAERLRAIVPEARIAVAHGQMKSRELEKVMDTFVNKGYDILLSTSIIESGLDIPSANTIIINRANMFGLADIYQLRGRVGRSRHRAYAYLLVPPDMALTGDARKRLEVLRELSGLGAGFRIATHDLEIRGAGELLGSAQSGQIGMVGFEMYNQLLEEAVRELRGEKVEQQPEPEIHLSIPAYLPEGYIPDTKQRLNLYKRMATVTDDSEIDDLRVEVRDRFGTIPPLVDNLFKIVSLKLLLKRGGIAELLQRGREIHLRCGEDTGVDTCTLMDLMKSEPQRITVTPDSRLIYRIDNDNPIEATRYLLQLLMK